MMGPTVDVFWTTVKGTPDSRVHLVPLDGNFNVTDRTVCGRGIPDGAVVLHNGGNGVGGTYCRKCQHAARARRRAS